MKKDTKQIVVYGAFGLLLGAKIVDVLFTGNTSLLDWWLLIMGVAAAIVHYLPEKADAVSNPQEQDWPAQEPADEGLVLSDYPHPQRSRPVAPHPEGHREKLGRR